MAHAAGRNCRTNDSVTRNSPAMTSTNVIGPQPRRSRAGATAPFADAKAPFAEATAPFADATAPFAEARSAATASRARGVDEAAFVDKTVPQHRCNLRAVVRA